jgi:WD40 repeat protein
MGDDQQNSTEQTTTRTNAPLWMGMGPDGPVHITLQNAWGFDPSTGATRWHRKVDIQSGAHARSAPVMALALMDRLVVVDTRSWNRLVTFERKLPPATAMALSPDGARLAFDDGEGVTLFEIPSGQERKLRGVSQVRGLSFRADGRWLAAGSEGGDFEVWRADDGDDVTPFVLDVRRFFNRHEQPVYDVALSDDGRLLATGDAGSDVRVWDLEAGKLLHHLDRLVAGWGAGLAWLHGGKMLVTGSNSGSLRAWDADRGALSLECRPTSDWVRSLTSVGDDRVVSLTMSGTMDTWQPGHGSPGSLTLVRSSTDDSATPL